MSRTIANHDIFVRSISKIDHLHWYSKTRLKSIVQLWLSRHDNGLKRPPYLFLNRNWHILIEKWLHMKTLESWAFLSSNNKIKLSMSLIGCSWGASSLTWAESATKNISHIFYFLAHIKVNLSMFYLKKRYKGKQIYNRIISLPARTW